MTLALGLLALTAAFGDPEPAADCCAATNYTYEIRFLDLGSLDWRSDACSGLKMVDQQQGSMIWLADDAALGSLLGCCQGESASNVVQAPKVTSPAGATACVANEEQRNYVAHIEKLTQGPADHPTALAFKPEIRTIDDGCKIVLSGTPAECGTKLNVCVDETRFLAFHTAIVKGRIAPQADGRADRVDAQCQVPEVAQQRVVGTWTVPAGQNLVVSLGARTVEQGRMRKRVVRETLVVITPHPVCDESLIGPITMPKVAKIDPVVLPASAQEPAPADARPAPPLPTREIPSATAPDGTPVAATLPDDAHREPSADDSAEPRPTPQSKHVEVAAEVTKQVEEALAALKIAHPAPKARDTAVRRTEGTSEGLTPGAALRIGMQAYELIQAIRGEVAAVEGEPADDAAPPPPERSGVEIELGTGVRPGASTAPRASIVVTIPIGEVGTIEIKATAAAPR